MIYHCGAGSWGKEGAFFGGSSLPVVFVHRKVRGAPLLADADYPLKACLVEILQRIRSVLLAMVRNIRVRIKSESDKMNATVFLNWDDRVPRPRTFIVLGAYRGGTSLIAGSLGKMGIFMGYKFDGSNNHEDLEFRQKSVEEVSRLINVRNIAYDVWGWKDPGFIDIAEQVVISAGPKIRNPHFIVVFRDTLAISQSEFRSINQPLLTGIRRANDQSTKLAKFVIKYSGHKNMKFLLVSYERAINRPRMFVDAMVKFCGIDVDKEKIEELVNFTTPGSYKAV